MDCNIFQVRLAEARERGIDGRAITQQELADLLGIKREIVAYWENGTREPKAEQLYQISKALGVTSDYLLGLTDIQTLDPEKRSSQEYTGLSDDALSFFHKYMNDVGEPQWYVIRMVEKLIKSPDLLYALHKADQKVVLIESSMAADPTRFCDPSQEGAPDESMRRAIVQEWITMLESALFFVGKSAVNFAETELEVQRVLNALEAEDLALGKLIRESIAIEQDGE